MFLDIGNIERIDEPSCEQISHHLRHLSAESPFLILNADEELFLQVTPTDGQYRVELRQGKQQWYALLPLDRTEELFAAFLRWDEPAVKSIAWRPVRIWNDPYSMAALCIFVSIVLALWPAFRHMLLR